MNRLEVFLVLFLLAFAVAQAETTTQLDEAWLENFRRDIEARFQNASIVGAVVAVVQDGEIKLVQGLGYRNLETKEPVTPSTVFRIGSTAKSMTAMMLATLVDEGKLSWETPAKEIFPELVMPTPELTERLTLRDLLSMATGLGDMVTIPEIERLTPEQLVTEHDKAPILRKPYEVYHYNNFTYALGGYAGVMASGRQEQDWTTAYRDLMQERVFGPIGMTTADVRNDPSMTSAGKSNLDYAQSYSATLIDGKTLYSMPFMNMNALAPAGAVVASTTDMAKYLITQLQGGVAPNGERVVSQENLEKTWNIQPAIDSQSLPQPLADGPSHYHMGWLSFEFKGEPLLFHSGNIDSYFTEMLLLPEANVGIVVMSNTGLYQGEFWTLATMYRFVEKVIGSNNSVSTMLYDLHPRAIAKVKEMSDQFSRPLSPEDVKAFVGDYEDGWRIELREGYLWLIGKTQELVLVPTDVSKGEFIVGGLLTELMGQPVKFETNNTGETHLTFHQEDLQLVLEELE